MVFFHFSHHICLYLSIKEQLFKEELILSTVLSLVRLPVLQLLAYRISYLFYQLHP